MKTLYIERSATSGRNGAWTEALDLDGVGRIVVGTGPGSFAGIRAAIAFAQGYSVGSGCEVMGLPSPCAVAAQFFAASGRPGLLAVVGDARRGMCWIAPFDGYKMLHDTFQVERGSLGRAVRDVFGKEDGFLVVSPDSERLGAFFEETFGACYAGGMSPSSEGLRAFAEANPSLLAPEPTPVYLNPAVRD